MEYIAYYRVSTQKQNSSGLGLAAQRKAVADYVRSGTILAHYEDIESGKSNTRPKLLEAIQHSKNTNAKLVIAKLDRLSRNVQFISALMESKVKFVCCDLPDASDLTIHIFAALAEWERKRISTRVKEALQAARARGTILGKPENLTIEGRRKGAYAVHEIARSNNNTKQAAKIANLLRRKGFTLLNIVAELNSLEMKTPRGHDYRLEQVRRLITKPIEA